MYTKKVCETMSAYRLTGCLAIRDGLLDAEEKLIWMEYAGTHTHMKLYRKKYLQMIKIVIGMGI